MATTRPNRYEAFITRESFDYARGTVRLLLWGPVGALSDGHLVPGAATYLKQDGNWAVSIDQSVRDDDAGLLLPAEAIEAIAVAIQEFQGHASHADTEARVLREWLAAERARVDQVLGGPRR